MIRHFADSDAEKLYRGQKPRRLPTLILGSALRKLLILNAAELLGDLRIPPGNRLERLKGDRGGQYSIRINDRWRICFERRNGDAYAVEVTDYHS